MGRSYSALERIAFQISQDGGTLKVDFRPPEDFVRQSSYVARRVLARWEKSYKKPEKPSYLSKIF